MRKPGGYVCISDPGKPLKEADAFTCIHCNRIVVVPPKASPSDMGGWCALCAKPVCKYCTGKSCEPFERKLEIIESRDRLMRSLYN